MEQQDPCNKCGMTIREQMKGCRNIYCYRQHLKDSLGERIIDENGHEIYFNQYTGEKLTFIPLPKINEK